MFKKLSPIVVLLGSASLFADIASESIYPLLPIFLTQVLGASVLSIGIIEGVAEAVSSGMKVFSGYLADRSQNYSRFVFWGYLISTCRSLIGIASSPWHVFFIRFSDRLGKGLRSSPRDAWLSHQAKEEDRGLVFGFNRAMDHLGATLAPIFVGIFFVFYPGEYRALFLLTIIPGLISVLMVLRASKLETKPSEVKKIDRLNWKKAKLLSSRFWKFLFVLFVFGLACSADSFLILKLQDLGFETAHVLWVWGGLNGIKSLSSLFGGRLSDKIGALACTQMGWLLYALLYLTLAFSNSTEIVLLCLAFYGIFFGLTEGPEKSLVSFLSPSDLRATAFGFYHLTIGLSLLPANILFGAVWQKFSPGHAFAMAASIAFLALFLSFILLQKEEHN